MNRQQTNHTISLFCLLLLQACGTSESLKKPAFQATIPIPEKVSVNSNGSIYNADNNRFLFEDIKARRVGDLITVILDEKTNAVKSATTSTSKDANIDLPGPTLLGLPVTMNGKEFLNNTVENNTTFAGSGDSAQSNSLTGNITVTVANVLSNGNLMVQGEKLLTLNQGSEVVRISGIVRVADITPKNTIISTQIANANITYGGNGMVADSNRAGWATRFFNSPLWPF